VSTNNPSAARAQARSLTVALTIGMLCLASGTSRAQTDASPELSLDDAVAAALANEPRLKAAEQQWQAAHARRITAEWNRLGQLSTSFLYTPEQRPLSIEFPGIPPYVPATSFEVRQLNRYSASATLTQPVWTWGALSSQRASARHDEGANRQSLARTRQQTAFEARRSFLQAATAAAAVGVSEQSLAQQRAFLELSQARERAGAVPHLDVLKAELAVARAQADLSQARHADRLAREALASATMDARFRSAPLRQPEAATSTLPVEEVAIAAAQQRRPDLLAINEQADALRQGARATTAAALPALALRASITQQNDVAGDIFRKSSQLYQAGLVVSWDAFEPLRARSKAAELRANERGARESQRAITEAVALDVRSALLSAREARERIDVESHAVTVAEEQARVARLAYREGLITAVEAQDAELALTAARFALLTARHDNAISEARLKLAMGE
jgi:outer membrane protein TolC